MTFGKPLGVETRILFLFDIEKYQAAPACQNQHRASCGDPRAFAAVSDSIFDNGKLHPTTAR
jgi:hypothetical protein